MLQCRYACAEWQAAQIWEFMESGQIAVERVSELVRCRSKITIFGRWFDRILWKSIIFWEIKGKNFIREFLQYIDSIYLI